MQVKLAYKLFQFYPFKFLHDLFLARCAHLAIYIQTYSAIHLCAETLAIRNFCHLLTLVSFVLFSFYHEKVVIIVNYTYYVSETIATAHDAVYMSYSVGVGMFVIDPADTGGHGWWAPVVCI